MEMLELLFGEEAADQAGDLAAFFFEREVAGVDEVKLQILQVAAIGLRAFGREDNVVLAPDDEGGRLVPAEILLPFRVSI